MAVPVPRLNGHKVFLKTLHPPFAEEQETE